MKEEKKVETQVMTEVKSETPVKEISKLTGKYVIKPIKQTWLKTLDPKHDGAYVFSKAENWVSPERDGSTGLIKTGLTEQQARELEQEMNLKVNDLSPYSKWWDVNFKMYPRIPRDGVTLDLDRSALDKLKYLYLCASSKVAKSEAQANGGLDIFEYVMTSTEIEAVHDNKKNKIKKEAYKIYTGMTLSEQMDFLKVYEEGRYRLTKNASPDVIESTTGRIVDENPQEFVSIVSNPDFKAMIFLQDCIAIGAVKKFGARYETTTGDKLGYSFLDAIANLQKPDYDEVKVGLLAKLKSVK